MNSKLIAFRFIFFIAFCFVVELIMRFLGFIPGDLRPNWTYFTKVDSLVVIPQFKTNENGIMVADSAYWANQNVRINSAGFRSGEFTINDSSKTRILVIGDSYTWGMSAHPIQDSSFCDLLHSSFGLQVFNCGIPVADPVQYHLIAKKYIELLKPNYVLVMFFSGNDIMRTDREAKSNRESYYWTNAGAIYADMDGKHFDSAQDAYKYLVNERYFLENPRNMVLRFISKSAFLSRLYAITFRIKEKAEAMCAEQDPSVTLKYLRDIKEEAERNNATLHVMFIPELKFLQSDAEKKYGALFRDQALKDNWLVPDFKETHYKTYPDGHWNNSGHAFVADYLYHHLKAVKPKDKS